MLWRQNMAVLIHKTFDSFTYATFMNEKCHVLTSEIVLWIHVPTRKCHRIRANLSSILLAQMQGSCKTIYRALPFLWRERCTFERARERERDSSSIGSDAGLLQENLALVKLDTWFVSHNIGLVWPTTFRMRKQNIWTHLAVEVSALLPYAVAAVASGWYDIVAAVGEGAVERLTSVTGEELGEEEVKTLSIGRSHGTHVKELWRTGE